MSLTPEERALKFVKQFICILEGCAEVIELSDLGKAQAKLLTCEIRQAEEDAFGRGYQAKEKEHPGMKNEIMIAAAEKRGAEKEREACANMVAPQFIANDDIGFNGSLNKLVREIVKAIRKRGEG